MTTTDGDISSRYEPRSKVAEQVLFGRWFRPFLETLVVAEQILTSVDASEREVADVLRELESKGLLAEQSLRGVYGAPKGPAYIAAPALWELREEYLFARGLRHRALVHQREYDLDALLTAIMVSNYIENERPGKRWAMDTKWTPAELTFYLKAYPPEDVATACGRLLSESIVVQTKKHRVGKGDEDAFDLTVRGRRDYENRVAKILRIASGQHVLDAPVTAPLVVFDAWQSECAAAHDIIEAVLPEVIEALNSTAGLVRPLEIIRAAAAGDGAIRIDATLQERIRNADFFIGDLTPVYAYNNRLRVNENVLVEVGFALASKDANQIILLALHRDDVPGDDKNPQRSFDIAHVRRHEFKTKNELQCTLKIELEAALRARGWLR